MDHPLPWLRFISASDLDDDTIDFDDMNIESPTGEHLGDVEGFIVDANSTRPYYVVADAGGWFKTKHFLLPVGHARFDSAREVLVADLTRDHVERFPGFDPDAFERLSADELKQINDETCRACTIVGVAAVYSGTDSLSDMWDRPDFTYPEWWRGSTGASEADTAIASASQPTASTATASRTPETARPSAGSAPAQAREWEREAVTARERDQTSSGQRAQPGDVIGVESGGERTSMGDTAKDEQDRLRDAEKHAEGPSRKP